MQGRRIGGRYQLERKLADGGMGTIWVARDLQLQRWVALKLMASERIPTPRAALHQFAQEAKAVAQLHHPLA